MSELKKKAKAEFSTLAVHNVLVPQNMDMPEFGEAAHEFIKMMTSEDVTGPRTFEDVPSLDGARAFAQACKKVLGADITNAAAMGNVQSIEASEHVLVMDDMTFTRSQMLDRSKMDEATLAVVAKRFMKEAPLNVELNRESIANEVAQVAPIVGVTPMEISAAMGHVALKFETKNFGEAMLDEDSNGDFVLMIKSTKQYAHLVRDIIREVEHQIKTNSIYKGLPYSYSDKKFINDLDFNTADRIALTSDTSELVRAEAANRLINEKRALLDLELKSKKCIILANGKGGVGKTETARALGALAVRERRAFLIYMPERADVNDFKRFLQFASKVGPAFILIEDIEKMIDVENPIEYSTMLEVLDGVTSKSREVDIWINSNNAGIANNEFRDTFLRRVNTYIDFDAITDAQLQSLFAIYLGENWELYGELKYESDLFAHNENKVPDEEFELHPKMERLIGFVREYEFLPWAVYQTIAKAIHYRVDRGDAVITEDHLLSAAKSVVSLHQLVKASKGTPKKTVTIDSLVRAAAAEGMQATTKVDMSSGDLVSKS
jgi:hypothetical protein